MEQRVVEFYTHWVQEHYGCEVYLIDHPHQINGFVEYRNEGHIIYILADTNKLEQDVFLDILAHELGHVLYNQEMLDNGMSYSEIVDRTQVKLSCFQQLLDQRIITNEEYTRLYDSIEEEWYSNQKKDEILKMLKAAVGMDPI
ncbi:MAG TPA: hypothetical protein VJ824_07820 [Bacillota bacterium]|nr:hypothetical protein [Bacillota bacterium]